MSIKKTNNGTYRLRRRYPADIADALGVPTAYDKIFKTKKEATSTDAKITTQIDDIQNNRTSLKGTTTFEEFYFKTWLTAYKVGSTSTYPTPPTQPTIDGTLVIFKNHLLPMFGEYSLDYLVEHKQFVIESMTTLASKYANFKIFRAYFLQLFDLAEEYDYIRYNVFTKPLRKIKSVKKTLLKQQKKDADKFLSKSELTAWFNAIETDYNNGDLTMQDYVLFWTTFFLSDRKSESYALQWKHVDFAHEKIFVVQALDKYAKVKSTKSGKSTEMELPKHLKPILKKWKQQQATELAQFNITQSPEQFVFSYNDRSGNINVPVHSDFLNYRLKSINHRHPELAHCTPHKLRHTSATIAHQTGMAMDAISSGLTHSDVSTTKIYVNDNNVVKLTPADYAYSKIING